MRTGHPAVKPSAHTTEAGKTARGWLEEQIRSKNNSAEVRAGTCQIQVPASPLPKGQQSSPVLSTVSGHLLYCVRSLWSSPVLCPQSLVISCTVSAVSGHLL
ncbi:unnamed protein product, partial [Staurois parvus]